MKPMRYVNAVIVFMAVLLTNGLSFADHEHRGRTYEVTITNLTRNQIFSPPIVMSHNENFRLFRAGEEASPELYALAEDGHTDPLVNHVANLPYAVFDYAVAEGNLEPGNSVTLEVTTRRSFRLISAAGMLVTTNDAFFAIRDKWAPLRGIVIVEAKAYDAGSEANSENCAYIPGPPCGSADVRDTENAEGFVHVHSGIHGQTDEIDPNEYDWRNPVAKITIRPMYGRVPFRRPL
jgi:hypothetical protein